MRDLILTVVVFAALPVILFRPHVGILVWSWLGYMNPHRLTWGFAHNFPFSQLVGATLIVSAIFSKERKRIPVTPVTVIWISFILWMFITTLFAMYPEAAKPLLIKVIKIQLMTFLTIVLMQSRHRLDALMWVIVLSLGFFGVKGGAAIILTRSTMRLQGPGGFIEDNNALAIALLMTLPLMNYLRLNVPSKWIRIALLLSMFLMLAAIMATYSRAALLGIVAMAMLSWLKSRKKVVTAIGVAIIMTVFYFYAPTAWHERMGTITTVDEEGKREGSAQARVHAWNMIINLAKHRPIFGAGFDPWHEATYLRYSKTYQWGGELAQAAHSIYFSVLAEHGFIGLILFVSVFLAAWRSATLTTRYCKREPELTWLADLMAMIQLSMAGFMVAGMFHQLPYFDLPWHLVAITIIGRVMIQDREPAAIDAPGPALVSSSALDTQDSQGEQMSVDGKTV